MSREFYETRSLFRPYLQYTEPYSFEEWLALPEDHKAAALYVQFFDQIILAWYKSKSFYASEQEGVETVLQYLCKNVPLIEAKESKFSSRYIYRVAYNCLYCISHDRKCDIDRWEKEMSDVCEDASGCTVSMFDFLADDGKEDPYDLERRAVKQKFWSIIESDEDTVAVVNHLINNERLPKGFGRNHKVEIITHLKADLEEFKEEFYK